MIDARLSRDIETGAIARPRYKTDIITTDGGHEVRNSRWRYPLFEFEIQLEPAIPEADEDATDLDAIDTETLDELINLFHAVGGSHGTFPFRHWRDYSAVAAPLGAGDGTTTVFQLYKTYRRGLITRTRKILLPVTSTVIAKVAGVVTPVTVEREGGTITFAGAPAAAAAITADFEFDVPVRFADDELELIALADELEQPGKITLNEVRSL